ncbi:Coenzyme F420 hydrogenase/dehydrogenase, beta subunit C-terminal domain [Flavobacterium salmonis]|uniref:4Fe-4S ferredoxin-type domain-containing protein n=1 Tax=Flavobacterium salmonis TaxID=2654844 RepID=A0A6V6Z6F6_9FLAO|nr:Coenzyme F420 hydrogenase/dehydrogenase, beta subunit C-terminal domain [Flavobacterium salmonis]CAD0007368.1 hypothetical protein FLAT13_03816 [Flavobacterium salmonis]
MAFSKLNDEILKKDLCTGCGACDLVCPKDYIKFNEVFAEPITSNIENLNCGDCNLCYDVCPGFDAKTAENEKIIFGRVRKDEERWLGITEKLYGGKSNDPEVFNRSSSGGCVTTFLQAATKRYQIDYILVMGRDEIKPWRSAPILVQDASKLLNYCQSTYQLSPYLGKLKKIYRDHPEKNIAIVGLACHIQAIRKLQQIKGEIGEWAKNKIKFLIETACSSNTTYAGTEEIIKEIAGLELEDVKSIHYREGKYPGNIVIQTLSDDTYEVPFWKALHCFKKNKTHRCLSCADWMSGLSDVSVSDGDPNIFKSSLGLDDIEKHGRVFIRTKIGIELANYAVDNDFITLWEINFGDINKNLGLERKKNRRIFYEQGNSPIPLAPILNFKENSEYITDEELIKIPIQFKN